MGMKIDEAIIQATLLKDGVGKDTYKYEILTSLIDIAKKYQKIQEVMDSRPDDGAKSNSRALSGIEVIMYGDNN